MFPTLGPVPPESPGYRVYPLISRPTRVPSVPSPTEEGEFIVHTLVLPPVGDKKGEDSPKFSDETFYKNLFFIPIFSDDEV